MKLNKNEQFNQCHPGLKATPKAIRKEILNQVQDDSIGSEFGRSMLEMLGVLAVIGVLSIIGIAGYRKAMDKIHANNLITDTSRVAHQVSFERQMNPANETMEYLLSQHNPSTQYPVTFSKNTDQVFTLTMQNTLDKGLCVQVMKLNWPLPIATVLNNEQLTTPLSEDKCTDSNTLAFAFSNNLGSGEVEPTQAACPEGISRARDGSCSICDNGKVYLSYSENPCEEEVSGDCTSNNDCKETGQFCNLHREDDGSCDPPTEGTCEAIGIVNPIPIAGLGSVVVTNSSLNWWAAENWCRAQGKHLPKIDDLKCYINRTTKVQAGIHTRNSAPERIWCCAEGQECNPSDNWENSPLFSSILRDLANIDNGGLYWTSSPYDTYCDPWYIDIPGGFIHHPGSMTNPALSTLCVD